MHEATAAGNHLYKLTSGRSISVCSEQLNLSLKSVVCLQHCVLADICALPVSLGGPADTVS